MLLKEKQRKLLECLGKKSDGNIRNINRDELAKELSFDEETMKTVYESLKEDGFVKKGSVMNQISLTTEGIYECDKMMEIPKEFFPEYKNLLSEVLVYFDNPTNKIKEIIRNKINNFLKE